MSIQTDIKKMLAEAGWTQRQLAEAAGVNECALSKLLNRDGNSIPERLHPYIYGDKRPVPVCLAYPQPQPQSEAS